MKLNKIFLSFIRNDVQNMILQINVIKPSFHESDLPDVVVPDVGGGADDGHHGGLHPPALHHRAASGD